MTSSNAKTQAGSSGDFRPKNRPAVGRVFGRKGQGARTLPFACRAARCGCRRHRARVRPERRAVRPRTWVDRILAVIDRRPDTLGGLLCRLAGARLPFLITGRPAFDRAVDELIRDGRVRWVREPGQKVPRLERSW